MRLKRKVLKYFERVGIALSILLNVLLFGPSNQTFSARNHGWKRSGKLNLVWLIDFLVFWDKYHCLHSWLYWYTGKNVRKYGKRYLQQHYFEVQSYVNKGDYYENFD